jgi:cytidylate kinase
MKTAKNISPLVASVRAALFAQERSLSAAAAGGTPAPQPTPFVTVSRQAGAGGRTFARHLAVRLNEVDRGELPWAVWDRDLVERVSREHHIPESMVAQLESYHRTAFNEILAALFPISDMPDLDENQLYRRVAHTVRGVARAGRAVIVGRGGVYATRGMPGGVHVRLVAPLERRVKHIAELRHCSERDAAAEVHRLDAEREKFHRRFATAKAMLPEIFTITLNTGQFPEERLVECVLPLVERTPAQPVVRNRAAVEQKQPERAHV